MHVGLAISFLVHGALLALAVMSMARTQPFKPAEPEPVQVAVISADELVRLTQGDRNAKQLDATPAPPAPDSKAVKEPPKPKIVTPPPPPPPPPPVEAKVEPPPPPPAKEPEPPKPDPIADKLAMLPPDPVPGPDPAELKRKEDEARKLEEQKRAEEQKKKADAERRKRLEDQKKREEARKLAEAKKKAEEAKKKSFDDIMAEAIKPALKDNDPTKKPPPPGGTQTAMVSPKKGPAAGAPEGRDTQLTSGQRAMLVGLMRQQLRDCFVVNTGLDGIDKVVVEVAFQLEKDGRLAGQPRVVNRSASPQFSYMADSALRALEKCQPYQFPPELYDSWKSWVYEFSTRGNF